MEKVEFSKLEKFKPNQISLNNVFGGETVFTGMGVTASGHNVREYCTAAKDGTWLQWYDLV